MTDYKKTTIGELEKGDEFSLRDGCDARWEVLIEDVGGYIQAARFYGNGPSMVYQEFHPDTPVRVEKEECVEMVFDIGCEHVSLKRRESSHDIALTLRGLRIEYGIDPSDLDTIISKLTQFREKIQ